MTTRHLAEGYFPQPDYLDGRHLASEGHYSFEIMNPQTLRAAIPQKFFDESKPIALFSCNAMTLIRLGNKLITCSHYNHGYVDPRLIPNPAEERIENLLYGQPTSIAEKCDRQFARYARQGIRFINYLDTDILTDKRLDASDVVDLLIATREPIYIKGSISSGGRHIARLSFDDDGCPFIETSSLAIIDIIERAVERADEAKEKIEDKESLLVYPEPMREEVLEEFKRHAQKTKISVRSILLSILSSIDDPIIEREIPFELCNGARVEFRVICQADETDEVPHVVAHYCKESTDPVAANISISGRGTASMEVLKELVKQHHSPTQNADNYMQQIEKSVNRFAKHYFEQKGLKSFAVDLVPVWNNEKKELEFWLLEVKDRFGFTGLWTVDPKLAEEVEKRLSMRRQE
ncbi:MAG: hypothetical protein GYA55_06195 [SAR324 cluster bacterium]|uniref:Uncharacterized protein n=1 Tax=SAR324 cluster bacterium TaxID=2024889 RepID=A0A7X9IL86_9DELT|nr:hypothetical protein [SAR324 cluster bacterium]